MSIWKLAALSQTFQFLPPSERDGQLFFQCFELALRGGDFFARLLVKFGRSHFVMQRRNFRFQRFDFNGQLLQFLLLFVF